MRAVAGYQFQIQICLMRRHSDGHSLIPWQKKQCAHAREVVYFHAPVFRPHASTLLVARPKTKIRCSPPAETQQSNQKFPRTFNEIPPIRRSRLLAAFILTGCNTISPARVSEEPEARNQEEKCYQEFSALKNLDPATYENTVSR